jgi:protein tyrosine phosphatase
MLLEQRRNGQTLTREGVVNLVKEVRAQRNEHMVQTEAQLKVLFDLVDLLNKTVA